MNVLTYANFLVIFKYLIEKGMVNQMMHNRLDIRGVRIQPELTPAVCCAVILLVCLCACSSGPKPRPDASPSAQLSVDARPQRLISQYADMRETDTISWLWTKPGFTRAGCRSFQVHPVQNFSQVSNAEVQHAVEDVLREALANGNGTTGVDISVTTAIVELRLEPGMIKKFFRSFSDYPYIEVEIVMHEEPSKAPLLKLCHYSKADELKTAVAAMLHDLQTFLKQEF